MKQPWHLQAAHENQSTNAWVCGHRNKPQNTSVEPSCMRACPLAHFTSMKNELGLCTRRFLLCFCCSYSLVGLSRSISACSTCARCRHARPHKNVSRCCCVPCRAQTPRMTKARAPVCGREQTQPLPESAEGCLLMQCHSAIRPEAPRRWRPWAEGRRPAEARHASCATPRLMPALAILRCWGLHRRRGTWSEGNAHVHATLCGR